MSQIINELATIEVDSNVLQQLDVAGIYNSFASNYKKLDDLKNFRSAHEKRNALMRWWHNDKLKDAQLDSAEVQAEFSKTIGQLMMISIMQSKKLSEQQTQLNSQQTDLQSQADGIAAHANELQEQHIALSDQSNKLENLVREYFDLKGLTEDGAEKLIKIAAEIKTTKENLLQEFSTRTQNIESQFLKINAKISNVSTETSESIKITTEKIQADMASMREKTRNAASALEEVIRQEQKFMKDLINQQEHRNQESQNIQSAKNSELEAIFNEKINATSIEAAKNLRFNTEKIQANITSIEEKTREANFALEEAIRKEQKTDQQLMRGIIEKQEYSNQESQKLQTIKNSEFTALLNEVQETNQKNTIINAETTKDLTSCILNQNSHKTEYDNFKVKISLQINRLIPIAILTSIATTTIIGGVVYFLK